MRTSRREFLQTSALASLAALIRPRALLQTAVPQGSRRSEHLNASEIARRHMIVRDITELPRSSTGCYSATVMLEHV